jgi:sRNA-binding protein
MSEHPQSRTDRLLHDLRGKFPALAEFRPLVRGVERELIKQVDQTPSWRVIAALRKHVSEPRYLRAVAQGDSRYNLFGEPVEDITDSEQKFALAVLFENEEADGDSPARQAPEAFTYGVRSVLLVQVGARFGATAREETARQLDGALLPETVEQLAVAILDTTDAEEWRDTVDTMSLDFLP